MKCLLCNIDFVNQSFWQLLIHKTAANMIHTKKMLPLTKAQMKKINGGGGAGCRPFGIPCGTDWCCPGESCTIINSQVRYCTADPHHEYEPG
jgi:hypothetical protein